MKKPIVIGVAGGTGSGKTTIVQTLIEKIASDQVAVILHDSYYRDRSHLSPIEREDINYDHPDALETPLLIEHVHKLVRGDAVNIPIYDFKTHTRTEKVSNVVSSKVIIVEGILILADPILRNLMDIRVFVDTDDDIRLIRRLKRDISERGRTMESVIMQYLDTVKPMHLEFVAPSMHYADIIIPEGGFNRVAIDMLITKVVSILRTGD